MAEPLESPRDLQAERALLGALLTGAVHPADIHLAPDDFWATQHQHVYRALRDYANGTEAPDWVQLVDALRASGTLDLAGGPGIILDLARLAGVASSVPGYVRIIREKAQRRRIIHAAIEAQEAAHDPTSEPARIVESLVSKAATDSSTTRFVEAAVPLPVFIERAYPAPPRLLGDVFRRGDLGILYGKPGLGKTWLLMHLALSIVRGEPWFGIDTQPARVGFVSLEAPADELQTRFRALGVHAEDMGLEIVARPDLRGAVDLLEDSGDLMQWIRSNQLDLVMLDPLSRIHTADENQAVEFARVLARLDRMRHETGAAILLSHHDRKAQAGDSKDHLDALRGSSRLQSDPTLLVHAYNFAGSKALNWAKNNFGKTPPEIYYKLNEESGAPEQIEGPKEKSDAAIQHTLDIIRSGSNTLEEIVENTGYTKRTVRRYVKKLLENGLVSKEGTTKNARFIAAKTDCGQQAVAEDVNAIADISLWDF